MANLNKVMLIGRLTRDPEVRVFAAGGKVANFGFATNNRKKNATTGAWEDDPMFIDVKIFNRGDNGTLADRAEQNLRKGKLIFLEGKLVLEQWDDKQTGAKRSKHVLVADNFQYLEPRAGGGEDGYEGEGGGYQQRGGNSGGGGFSRNPPSSRPAPTPSHAPDYDEPHPSGGSGNGPPEEDIPF